MRYFIELAYHGKSYHGWQVQPNAISVQQVIEDRLGKLLRQEISVVAAGRTDAGVHARQMFVHLDLDKNVNGPELCHRLNSFLPADIAVRDVFRVHKDAHARFDAVSRSYEYHITLVKDPFEADRSWLLHHAPDLSLMNKASRALMGRKDFKCFSRSNTDVKTYYCEITEAVWKQIGDRLVFRISADRFLRNMVRAVVGTLLEVGLGKMSIQEFKSVVESRDRSRAGASVPAKGLFLTSINYPESIKR